MIPVVVEVDDIPVTIRDRRGVRVVEIVGPDDRVWCAPAGIGVIATARRIIDRIVMDGIEAVA